MADSQQFRDLLRQLPEPDDRGMLTTNIDKQKIEGAIEALHQGGRQYVLALIDLLGMPGSEQDVQPRYALHCLANHVLVAKDETGRSEFCQALASQLGGDRPKHVQAFLCQELAWAGGAESVSALGRLLTDEQLCGPASMALVAIGDGAAAEFLSAWPKAVGVSRRHIMDGLAALADVDSTEVFMQGVNDTDREVRIAAAAGLASLGQAGAAEALIRMAETVQGWERIQAAKNCLVLAERLASRGQAAEAKRVYQHLQKADEQQHIREAAQRGLATLG
jgi:hypothetical protein